jgi:hypothetical protein
VRRREFITRAAALWPFAATIWPITALARQGPWHIGWLDPSMTPTAAAPSQALAAFKQRLAELGYVEGRDFVIEERFETDLQRCRLHFGSWGISGSDLNGRFWSRLTRFGHITAVSPRDYFLGPCSTD